MDDKYKKPMLVGIKGKIGAGKSTSATILKGYFEFVEYAMADPIKQIALILGFDEKEIYGTQDERLVPNEFWGVSGREFLQKFGTDVCREFLPTQIPQMSGIWVRLFQKFLSNNKSKNVLISDIRFLSEGDAIRQNGGIIIEIDRGVSVANGIPSGAGSKVPKELDHGVSVADHKSETEQDRIRADYIIKNTGSLEDLTTELQSVIIKHYLI